MKWKRLGEIIPCAVLLYGGCAVFLWIAIAWGNQLLP